MGYRWHNLRRSSIYRIKHGFKFNFIHLKSIYIMNNLPKSGRRSGCGACGKSESHELMQLTSVLPWSSILEPIRDEVPGKRNDIPKNSLLARKTIEA